MNSTIELEIQGRLASITLAKPPLNILDLDDLAALGEAVRKAEGASVLLLRAADDCRAFSAGNAIQDHTADRAPEMLRRFHAVVAALLKTDAITVAKVRGAALGGGCELVTACDLVYATADARFGQPEIKVGCFPPVAAALLPGRIGWTRAVEMITTGRIASAEEAERWGLVTRIGEAPIEELLSMSAPVLAATKRAMRARSLEAAERIYKDDVLPLEDCVEGVQAFLDKRPPEWRH